MVWSFHSAALADRLRKVSFSDAFAFPRNYNILHRRERVQESETPSGFTDNWVTADSGPEPASNGRRVQCMYVYSQGTNTATGTSEIRRRCVHAALYRVLAAGLFPCLDDVSRRGVYCTRVVYRVYKIRPVRRSICIFIRLRLYTHTTLRTSLKYVHKHSTHRRQISYLLVL